MQQRVNISHAPHKQNKTYRHQRCLISLQIRPQYPPPHFNTQKRPHFFFFFFFEPYAAAERGFAASYTSCRHRARRYRHLILSVLGVLTSWTCRCAPISCLWIRTDARTVEFRCRNSPWWMLIKVGNRATTRCRLGVCLENFFRIFGRIFFYMNCKQPWFLFLF